MLLKGAVEPNYRLCVFTMSAGFFGIFMAFNAAQALATSTSGSLGNICLATLYGTFAATCVVAPKLVDYLGPRMSMIIGGLPYIGMIFSNLNPSYYVSIPMYFLVGLGAPLIWTGQGVYTARCAYHHAQSTGIDKQEATSMFNGIFFSSFQANGTMGLLLASSILLFVKGSNSIEVLFYVLGFIAVVGILILTTVKEVPPAGAGAENQTVALTDTLYLCVSDVRMAATIPIIIYNGASLGFMFGDFTAFAAGKALGTALTGFVIAAFFFVNAVATYLFALAASKPSIGRRGTFQMATLLHVVFFGLLLMYQIPENFKDGDKLETPGYEAYLFIFLGAFLFGAGDAVFESQVPALLQSFFQEDSNKLGASMANLKMWQSIGFTIQFVLGFVLSSYFQIKVIILLVELGVAVLALWYMHSRVQSMDESSAPSYSAVPGEVSAAA